MTMRLPKQRLTDSRIQAISPPATGQDEYPDQLVVGLRLRIGTSGKKTWIVRAKIEGRAVNNTLGHYPALSLSVARQLAREKLLKLAVNGEVRKQHTVGDVVNEFIVRYAKPRNRTWQKTVGQFKTYVLPFWEHRNITDIRKSDVIALLDRITDRGATTTANRILSALSKLFRWSLSRDLIDINPVSGIAKPGKETARDRVLSDFEIAALWRTTDLMGYPFGILIKLLLLTGQRLREVSNMKWVDVDFEAGAWVLSRDETKADRKHLVPLSVMTLDLLVSLPRMTDTGCNNLVKPSPFVLTTNGSSPISGWSKAKYRADKLLCSILKIETDALDAWVFHDLRRTMATNMTRHGVPRFTVSRILNHAEPGVTGKHYDHYEYQTEKRDALNKWAAVLQEMCSKHRF
jgi:integrase